MVTPPILRAARIAQGHTQDESAVALDVTRATVAGWEIGRRRIPSIKSWYGTTPDNARAQKILDYVAKGRESAGFVEPPPAPPPPPTKRKLK